MFGVLIVVILLLNPRQVGQWVARVDSWRKYYTINVAREHHHQLVRYRAINIKKIRRKKLDRKLNMAEATQLGLTLKGHRY